MKFNNHGQLIFTVFFSILTALLFALGALSFFNNGTRNTSAVSQEESDYAIGNLQYFHDNTYPEQRAYTAQDLSSFSADERENITVYERYNEAVVNITTEVVGINWFLEPVPQRGASGSGSIIDTQGFVLTNHHVIERAVRIYITLFDGSQHEGTVVGIDPENDLAVLRFTPPR